MIFNQTVIKNPAVVLDVMDLYTFSKNEQATYFFCDAFVKENSKKCLKCGSALIMFS